jgi:hypothetical protein
MNDERRQMMLMNVTKKAHQVMEMMMLMMKVNKMENVNEE